MDYNDHVTKMLQLQKEMVKKNQELTEGMKSGLHQSSLKTIYQDITRIYNQLELLRKMS